MALDKKEISRGGVLDWPTLVLTNDEGKRCSRCKRVLPLTRFNRSRRSRDTYQSWCCECHAEYKRTRRLDAILNKSLYAHSTLRELVYQMPTLERKEKTDIRYLMKHLIKLTEK